LYLSSSYPKTAENFPLLSLATLCELSSDTLDFYIFNNLNEVKQITEDWIELYNTERPHDSLNDMTPLEYRNAA